MSLRQSSRIIDISGYFRIDTHLSVSGSSREVQHLQCIIISNLSDIETDPSKSCPTASKWNFSPPRYHNPNFNTVDSRYLELQGTL